MQLTLSGLMIPYGVMELGHPWVKPMGVCKNDVTPLLTQWGSVFFALIHRDNDCLPDRQTGSCENVFQIIVCKIWTFFVSFYVSICHCLSREMVCVRQDQVTDSCSVNCSYIMPWCRFLGTKCVHQIPLKQIMGHYFDIIITMLFSR